MIWWCVLGQTVPQNMLTGNHMQGATFSDLERSYIKEGRATDIRAHADP